MKLMPRICAFIGAAVITLSLMPAAVANATEGDLVRTMTWNVKTRGHDPSEWARLIGKQEPDVVGLQEICMRELPELVRILKKDYKITYNIAEGGVRRPNVFYDGCNIFDGRGYGNAVLSRFRIVEKATTVDYRDKEPGERRAYMHLRVEINGSEMDVFNTHIGLKDVQPKQIAQLREAVLLKGPRTIVLGDFNARTKDPGYPQHDEWLRDFRTVLSEVDPNGVYKTSPNKASGGDQKKIDYIFFRGLTHDGRVENYDTPSSDHRPLIANLRVA